MINIIAAVDLNYGLSKNGIIPWHNSNDLKHFKMITMNSAIIMGSVTYLTIGALPGRTNIILTRNKNFKTTEDVIVLNDPTDAINYCNDNCLKMFVIGGSQIYNEFINLASRIYLTKITGHYDCDTFFPSISSEFIPGNITYFDCPDPTQQGYMTVYNKHVYQEEQYLNLIRTIVNNGTLKSNRTGQDTLSVFGHETVWDLSTGEFPLLTTKKVFFKGIVHELLWFISGSTDSSVLENNGVKIWAPNTTREFLDKTGLKNLPEKDIGAGYGFQWRHSGAEYIDCKQNYDNQGVDQIKNLINGLIKDPGSRRHIVCSWNPSALSKMALPPCHVLFQLYIENGKLNSILYQRSADVGLGVPFNIASYALFTMMIAHCVDLVPGKFKHYTGDTHIYKCHEEPLKLQLTRPMRKLPTLLINTQNKDIFKFKYEDFEIINYNPCPVIKMDMVA